MHKKWYIQGELFGLTKKKLATVIVGLFSLEKRRLKTSENELKSLVFKEKYFLKNSSCVEKIYFKKRNIRAPLSQNNTP